MANELNIALPTSGLTVTVQPYQSGSAVGSAISLTEVGTSGFYTGDMTGSAGTYQLVFISAGANVGSGSIVWDGTAEVAVSTLTTSDLPTVPSVTDIRAELATELGRIDAAISTRSTLAAGDIPTADITAIKTRLDSVNVERVNNTATTNIVGTLLAQANS